MKTLRYPIFFVLAAGLAIATNANAGDSTAPNPYFAVLSTATAIELPAKAAALVSKADSKQRQQTTIDVVKAAVPLNPEAAPAIVGSIAQSAPKMAAIAAVTAAGLVPDQAAAIAYAAAAAAPSEAGKIVEAMCRALPAAYQAIAKAVAGVVPGAGKDILTAISTAIPRLKDPINQVLVTYHGNVPSVSTVLNQVQPTITVATAAELLQSTSGSQALADPVVGAPFVPGSGTHQNLNPGSGGSVVSRDYSAPSSPPP